MADGGRDAGVPADITFCVTTFLRHRMARQTVRRILRFAPPGNVLVCNDGPRTFQAPDGVRVLEGHEDRGLGAARNRLAAAVDTDRLMVVDDDWIVRPEVVARLAAVHAATGTDIVAGRLAKRRFPYRAVRNPLFAGTFEQHRDSLRIRRTDAAPAANGHAVNLAPSCMVARTTTMRDHPWAEDVRNGEHLAWFVDAWRAGLSVRVVPEAIVTDLGMVVPQRFQPTYQAARERALQNRDELLARRGIRRVEWLEADGTLHPA